MEQRIAAAVGIQPVAHILPGGDLVHGFVGDQLLEQRGRRVPVDGAQVEEAGVEPRQQQLAQVVVEALEIGVVAAPRTIGRASCRGRVWTYVLNSVVSES